jgi:predicted transcriptional regulator
MEKPSIKLKQIWVVDNAATGATIRDYRITQGVKQSHLSFHLGHKQSTVLSDMERGVRKWNQAKFDMALAGVDQLVEQKQQKQNNEHQTTQEQQIPQA